MLFKKVFTATLFCCTLWNAACVNKIAEEEEEILESDIPITFATKTSKTTTKATNTTFQKGDNVGLFAILSSANIENKTYIDNLRLECGDHSILIPEKAVFYPEGDLPLDFISYYPYQPKLNFQKTTTIPVFVETNQSDSLKHSQSNFLIAKKSKVVSSTQAVELEYRHKLTKIKIVLTPGKDENIQDMLKSNPRIVANGFKTKASYNLMENTFNDLDCTADIVAFGKWVIEEGTLIGKEFIIIPQELNADEQSFTIDWNGRLYNCQCPHLEKQEGAECEINISAMQTSSSILEGIVGKISDWETGTGGKTDNQKEYATIHLSALAYTQSNIYRIYNSGKPIAEICKEYLKSESLSSRAIVVYPVLDDEKTDLSQGIVLQLLDRNDAINGGKISWNEDTNSFTYQQGSSSVITQFYLNDKNEILLDPTDDIINVNITSYTLRDIRNGKLTEYPIVKIGTQYWMKAELHATAYQNGKSLAKLTELGKGAGYFKPDKYEIYFYNGEAVLAGKLNPIGWKIPSEKDWKQLKNYLNGDASLVKAGTWEALSAGAVSPCSNLTQFNAFPVGMWYNSVHYSIYKMTAFWSWDEATKKIPEQTVFFTGESNEFISNGTLITGKEYYKALSIRCIKE